MTASDEPLALQIVALAGNVAGLGGRLDTLTGRVGDLATAVAPVARLDADLRRQADRIGSLANRLDLLAEQGIEGGEDQPPSLWDWTAMDQEQAAGAWAELVTWMREVLAGWYDLVGEDVSRSSEGRRRRVPACWYRHPDVIAELSWLCQEWTRLYRQPGGVPARVGDWHDRYLPGVLRRIRTTSTAAGCRTNHRDAPALPTAAHDDTDHGAGLAEVM